MLSSETSFESSLSPHRPSIDDLGDGCQPNASKKSTLYVNPEAVSDIINRIRVVMAVKMGLCKMPDYIFAGGYRERRRLFDVMARSAPRPTKQYTRPVPHGDAFEVKWLSRPFAA